jgi:hypothetical protein
MNFVASQSPRQPARKQLGSLAKNAILQMDIGLIGPWLPSNANLIKSRIQHGSTQKVRIMRRPVGAGENEIVIDLKPQVSIIGKARLLSCSIKAISLLCGASLIVRLYSIALTICSPRAIPACCRGLFLSIWKS